MDWSRMAGALLALVTLVGAQERLKLCAPEDIVESSCNALSRSNSPVKCERVVDSVECAIKLANGQADFGVFTADELRMANSFYPTGLQVVTQLRNKDKFYNEFEFESVVIVSNHTSPGSVGLIGSGYCHPGFSKTQLWNDHVLKYFEKQSLKQDCHNNVTAIENELINLKNFFKKACRPGHWVPDEILDKKLKKKYPELCELCPDRENCRYDIPDNVHGHNNALDCLTTGKGHVAYVAFEHARSYFSRSIMNKKSSDYQFLCEDSTKMNITSEKPCTWFKQPWKVIIAREQVANDVIEKLEHASEITSSSSIWEKALNEILFRDSKPVVFIQYESPVNYLQKAGKVELPRTECGPAVRWCTVNMVETAKCNWTSAAARVLGIQPDIECVEAHSPFQCFDWISRNVADIMTIDSNYGLLARQVYGLTALMYCETIEDRYSVVVAVTRDKAQLNKIEKWSDVKNKNACFPEFGGIAWLSFINAARDHRILSDSCEYPKIVSRLLKGACAPGFVEADHAVTHKKPSLTSDGLGKLCDLCPAQPNGERCEASELNKYYGDKGALECLKSGDGDIAFIEARNLKASILNNYINPMEYRVLCKNGSLAANTGFNIDDTCALSVTIDSEVISRRNHEDYHLVDASILLLKLEDWLGYRVDSERRAIRIYDPFNGVPDILFKNSTIGLVPVNSEVKAVIAYKELFKHADDCSGAAGTTIALITLVFFNVVIARLF